MRAPAFLDGRAVVYRCFDGMGRLIYVGATSQIHTRLASHSTSAWWWLQVARIRFALADDDIDALTRERHAIATEAPRWNVRGRRPVVRAEYLDLIAAIEHSPAVYTSYNQRRLTRLRSIAGVSA